MRGSEAAAAAQNQRGEEEACYYCCCCCCGGIAAATSRSTSLLRAWRSLRFGSSRYQGTSDPITRWLRDAYLHPTSSEEYHTTLKRNAGALATVLNSDRLPYLAEGTVLYSGQRSFHFQRETHLFWAISGWSHDPTSRSHLSVGIMIQKRDTQLLLPLLSAQTRGWERCARIRYAVH